MAQIFDRIKLSKPKSSVFDLSHEKKLSLNMGDLVPIFMQETLPGDQFKVNIEHLIRFQPLLAPIMHRVNVYTHFFFVPNRLVWNDWEKFITGGSDGEQLPVFPRLKTELTEQSSVRFKKGTLADYLGFPSSSLPITGNFKVDFSLLPFRAYQLIYNEYYRDQNLTPPVEISKSSGIFDDSSTMESTLTLRKRAWEKDYFTSALPWAQRGEQLNIPIAGMAPVLSNGINPTFVKSSDGTIPQPGDTKLTNALSEGMFQDSAGNNISFGDESGLEADLNNVSASSINELRQAFSIQKWLEKNARGGSRYVEQLLAHFGVHSSDARLQRPEYLGGGKTPVIISEVLQNSSSTENSPQGQMAGHGISVGNTNEFRKRFEEHGFVIGIMSIIPRTSYQNGLPRVFQKYDKFDYFFPDLAHLGEQEVRKSELFLDTSKYLNDEENKGTFGYQPRYAEYRFVNDSVHGDMAGNLDFWHMGRKFTSLPPLNTSFVQSDPTQRIFAVEDPTEHKLIVQTYCNFQAIRPLPKFGTPGGL
jgi:hypothetical protein